MIVKEAGAGSGKTLPTSFRPDSQIHGGAQTGLVGYETTTYTLTARYGVALDELDLPAEITALLRDRTIVQLAVARTCDSDGSGGAVYIPEHENPLEAVYTVQDAQGG